MFTGNNYYGYYSYSNRGIFKLLEYLPLLLFLGSIILLLYFIAWCQLFRKADLPWERMFVPIYGVYWTYQIAECGWIFWLTILLTILSIPLAAIPFVGILILLGILILHAVYCVRLANAFDKGGFFAVGLILLNPIFLIVLGFGDSPYVLNASSTPSVSTTSWKCPKCGIRNGAHKLHCDGCHTEKPDANSSYRIPRSQSSASSMAANQGTDFFYSAPVAQEDDNSPRWVCARCQTENSERNAQCSRCNTSQYTNVASLPNDWTCNKCGKDNPIHKATCWNCSAAKPRGIAGLESTEVSKWTCVCGQKNLFSRMQCPACGENRPANFELNTTTNSDTPRDIRSLFRK